MSWLDRIVKAQLLAAQAAATAMDPQDEATLQGFESRNQNLNNTIDGQIQQLNARLNADHPNILNGVGLVFTRLNDIANFINGNYDVRCRQQPSLRDEYAALVKKLDEASNALVATVNGSEEVISNINIKLVDLRDNDLVKLRADIDDFKLGVDNRVTAAQAQKDAADSYLRQCSSSLDAARVDLDNAERKVKDAEEERDNAQIATAFAWLIPPVGAALQFGMMPKFQESLDTQRGVFNSAQNLYNSAQTNATNASNAAQKCLKTKNAADRCVSALPGAIQKSEQSLSRAEDVRKPVIKLQSLFQALSVQVGKIDNEGEDTGYSDRKERIIGDILDVIDYGLVDVSLVDSARKIIRDLRNGDEKCLISKQKLATALTSLENKIQTIGPINWSNKDANERNFTPVIAHPEMDD